MIVALNATPTATGGVDVHFPNKIATIFQRQISHQGRAGGAAVRRGWVHRVGRVRGRSVSPAVCSAMRTSRQASRKRHDGQFFRCCETSRRFQATDNAGLVQRREDRARRWELPIRVARTREQQSAIGRIRGTRVPSSSPASTSVRRSRPRRGNERVRGRRRLQAGSG